MKPKIAGTSFGNITVADKTYEYDIWISSDGEIHKRKKKLSQEIFGTSHVLSLPELEHIYEKDTDLLVFGTGQDGKCQLSEDAVTYLEKKGTRVLLENTPEAIRSWNDAKGRVIGLFHVTC